MQKKKANTKSKAKDMGKISPETRFNAIAEILAKGVLRIAKKKQKREGKDGNR